MMCSLQLPRWPTGLACPAVLRVQIIGDGREILATQYVEVAVPADRGLYQMLELRMDLADGNGTVSHAIAVALSEQAQNTRRSIAKDLDLAGFVNAAVRVLQMENKKPEGT